MHKFYSLERKPKAQRIANPLLCLPAGIIPVLACVPCLLCEGCILGAAGGHVKPATVCAPEEWIAPGFGGISLNRVGVFGTLCDQDWGSGCLRETRGLETASWGLPGRGGCGRNVPGRDYNPGPILCFQYHPR